MEKTKIIVGGIILLLISINGLNWTTTIPALSNKHSDPEITSLSLNEAQPGESITIYGTDFGTTNGIVIITGAQVEPTSWSDTEIIFNVPDYAATGFLYIRDSTNASSNSVDFTILRSLEYGYFEPYNLTISKTGLPGAAFLVETDGEYLYGLTGFETLCTYEIHDDQPYELCNRIYLPQRVGDIRLYNDYLFCCGDHGLIIYRCSYLQQGNAEVIASISGSHFLGVDVRDKPGEPINGVLVALCEYLPSTDNQLCTYLYKFQNEELKYLGSYTRTALSTERQHAIAIDPLNPKIYVSGFETLFGNNKYILEISIDNPSAPVLNHREETSGLLAFDMDALDDILWIGIVNTGTEAFRTYQLYPGTNHLTLDQIVTSNYGLGRTTRVKIVDDQRTIGSAWSGARPDIFLLDTFSSGTTPLDSYNSIDWAFDVTGFSVENEEYDGKIIIADEWGGFLTYEYTSNPDEITHQQDYHWTPASAMTQNIHLTDDRVYIANRGAGIWSADRNDISDETEWRHVPWEWWLNEPQPYPISGLAIRDDPVNGRLIAALGHEKAMAWGNIIFGFLYKETSAEITRIAMSEGFDPPGLYSTGESVVWPEPDLVFMTTGSDGIRAYVINPDLPSITLHQDCENLGFATDIFSTSNMANVMKYYKDGDVHKLLIGSKPGLLVPNPTFNVFTITYPEGIPNRNYPDRSIIIEHEISLNCTSYKTINNIDILPSGIVAIATNNGIALFHLSWIDELNDLINSQAWSKIVIPPESYHPYWESGWSVGIKDVCFINNHLLYCVKNPEGANAGGIWELNFEIDEYTQSHTSNMLGYYPGVQCGIDYSRLLQGWTNPDITTIHHPYALAADENDVFVTGWSGKVEEICYNIENDPPTAPIITGETQGQYGEEYNFTFYSVDPEGQDVWYYIEWGDGENEGWIGPYPSGEEITRAHTWDSRGTYVIKAKAKDTIDEESEWGSLEVKMPFNQKVNNFPILKWILYKFPYVFPLLRQILQI